MWNKIAERVVEWIGGGRLGRVVGTASGVFLGFIYLVWGFWDMLAFAVIVLAGYHFWFKNRQSGKMVGYKRHHPLVFRTDGIVKSHKSGIFSKYKNV